MVAISILLDSCRVSLKYARIEQVKERRLCWQSRRRHELESEIRRVCLESWGTVRQRGVQTRSQVSLSYSSTEGERTLGTRLRDLPYLYGDILLLQENLPLKRLLLDRPALKNKDLFHRDHERNLKRKSTQLKD